MLVMEKTRGVELMSKLAKWQSGKAHVSCELPAGMPCSRHPAAAMEKLQGSVPQWLRHWRYRAAMAASKYREKYNLNAGLTRGGAYAKELGPVVYGRHTFIIIQYIRGCLSLFILFL